MSLCRISARPCPPRRAARRSARGGHDLFRAPAGAARAAAGGARLRRLSRHLPGRDQRSRRLRPGRRRLRSRLRPKRARRRRNRTNGIRATARSCFARPQRGTGRRGGAAAKALASAGRACAGWRAATSGWRSTSGSSRASWSRRSAGSWRPTPAPVEEIIGVSWDLGSPQPGAALKLIYLPAERRRSAAFHLVAPAPSCHSEAMTMLSAILLAAALAQAETAGARRRACARPAGRARSGAGSARRGRRHRPVPALVRRDPARSRWPSRARSFGRDRLDAPMRIPRRSRGSAAITGAPRRARSPISTAATTTAPAPIRPARSPF